MMFAIDVVTNVVKISIDSIIVSSARVGWISWTAIWPAAGSSSENSEIALVKIPEASCA